MKYNPMEASRGKKPEVRHLKSAYNQSKLASTPSNANRSSLLKADSSWQSKKIQDYLQTSDEVILFNANSSVKIIND